MLLYRLAMCALKGRAETTTVVFGRRMVVAVRRGTQAPATVSTYTHMCARA